MKNKTIKKTLAGLIAVAIMVSALTMSAFAASCPVEGYGDLTGTIDFELGLSAVRYRTGVDTNQDSAKLGHNGTLYYNNGNSTKTYPMQISSNSAVGFGTMQDASGCIGVTKVVSTHQVSGGLKYQGGAFTFTTFY